MMQDNAKCTVRVPFPFTEEGVFDARHRRRMRDSPVAQGPSSDADCIRVFSKTICSHDRMGAQVATEDECEQRSNKACQPYVTKIDLRELTFMR
jgi:hypothetical protein